MRAWGEQRHAPRICGTPVQTRNGEACNAIPTWFQNGRWSCGHHRLDKTMNRSGFTRPAPPPPPPFESFECSICITKCTNVKNQYITPCNHSFHKKCMSKWYGQNNGRNILECPLCRHNITKHPFKRRRRTQSQSTPTIVPNVPIAVMINNLQMRNVREETIVLDLALRFLGARVTYDNSIITDEIEYINSRYIPTETDETQDEFRNRIMTAHIQLNTAVMNNF